MEKLNYLYFAHPGHELALAAWIRKNKPVINILTDGSGSDNRERLSSSRNFVDNNKAYRGSIFGRYSDKKIYKLIIDQSITEFQSLIEEILKDWNDHSPETVIVDELDGHNPTHDLMNILVSIACQIFSNHKGTSPKLFSYYLNSPLSYNKIDKKHRLDEESYQSKLRDIREYRVKPKSVDLVTYRLGFSSFGDRMDKHFSEPESVQNSSEDPAQLHINSAAVIDMYQSIQNRIEREKIEIAINLSNNSEGEAEDWLRYEYLKPLEYDREPQLTRYRTTFYELYGEEKVNRGVYNTVLRQQHLVDIWKKLKSTMT